MSTSHNSETVQTSNKNVIQPVGDENQRNQNRIQGALRRIMRAVEVDSKRLSSDYNITGPQLAALRCIVAEGPLTTTDISKAVHLSPSTIVGILDRLQARKLIQRRRGDSDRRQVFVKATVSGKQLAEELADPSLFGLGHAIDSLPKYERDSLTRALENIVDQLDIIEQN